MHISGGENKRKINFYQLFSSAFKLYRMMKHRAIETHILDRVLCFRLLPPPVGIEAPSLCAQHAGRPCSVHQSWLGLIQAPTQARGFSSQAWTWPAFHHAWHWLRHQSNGSQVHQDLSQEPSLLCLQMKHDLALSGAHQQPQKPPWLAPISCRDSALAG